MNARYYNPNTGRFISQDSYKGSEYEPWTQNLYVYTGNNPVNMVDPTGHRPVFATYDSDGGVQNKFNWWEAPEEIYAYTDSGGRGGRRSRGGSGGTGGGSGSGGESGSSGVDSGNDTGSIILVPSLTELYNNTQKMHDELLNNPYAYYSNLPITGVYFYDFTFSCGNIAALTVGTSYVVNLNEGWVAEYNHLGGGLSVGPVPMSLQITEGVVSGDITKPEMYTGWFREFSASVLFSNTSAVATESPLSNPYKNTPGAVIQTGNGLDIPNLGISGGYAYYTLNKVKYINGGT